MPRGDELAARIRAARAYADLSLTAAGELVNLSGRQFSRYEAGAWKEPPDTDWIAAVAHGCGVPMSFMRGGWDSIEEQPTVAERVEALEHRLETMVDQYDEMRDVIETTRRTTALAAAGAEADQADEAAPETRGIEDASEGSPRAPGEETRRIADGGDG